VRVARSFYSKLIRNGNVEYDDRAVALALHKSIIEIHESKEYGGRPLLWAQYVHYGA
jgi:hypothetical protein